MPRLIDLTGKRFGYLVAIEQTIEKSHDANWLCKCVCGQETVVRGLYLRRGLTKSCGCSQYQLIKEKSREKRTLKKSIRENLARVKGDANPTLIADAYAILRLRRTTVNGTQIERLRKIAAELERMPVTTL
jgi:hypothetical protein